MGLWDVTKRMLQGKPAFVEPPREKDDWDDDAPTTDFAEDRRAKRNEAPDLINDEGIKVIPVASVDHVRYILNEPYIEVWAVIRNHSDRALKLEYMTLMGQKTELKYPLEPGHEREFRVYRGEKITHDSYKKADLYYIDTATGDYFRAEHLVEYNFEADSTYTVRKMELITPIYDV